MMRSAVLAIAFFAVAGAASAQDMAGADANNDGQVTRAEAQAVRAAMFTRVDSNNDGYMSAEERVTARAAAQRRGGGQNVDANGDGRVSREEFDSQPMRLFDHFDANNNDVLDASEVAAMREAAQRRRR